MSYLFHFIFLSLFFVCSGQSLEEIYDAWADDYEKLVEKTSYNVADWINAKKAFLPKQGQYALDLGCANGMIGKIIDQNNFLYRFVGIDFSRNMVEACAKKSMYTQVIHADLNYGLPEYINRDQFDIVFATGCLEFIQNHAHLFSQIHQILKTQGQFWLTLQMRSIFNDEICDIPLTLYSEQEARVLLENNGFAIINFEINHVAYRNSVSKQAVTYFMIIAQKKGKA